MIKLQNPEEIAHKTFWEFNIQYLSIFSFTEVNSQHFHGITFRVNSFSHSEKFLQQIRAIVKKKTFGRPLIRVSSKQKKSGHRGRPLNL